MLNMQASTGGAEASRDVPGAIVGEHAPDADAVVAKSAERPPEKAGDGGAVIIGSELDVGDPRVIVDGDVQQIPTDAVVAIDIARPVMRWPSPAIRPSFFVSKCSRSPGRGCS